MFGARFYHETTRRYVAMFGTLFNDIVVRRYDNEGVLTQSLKVPLAYGPSQKFLSRLQEDPGLNAPAITLPRMSFEILGMFYDGDRKLTTLMRNSIPSQATSSSYASAYTPTPYNLEFQLNIMTKYTEDGTKIIEQILPYFKPDFTPSVRILDELEYYLDVPVILNSVTQEDIYEGTYDERRAIIWTLNFTVKAWYFGPAVDRKIIKFAQAKSYTAFDNENSSQTISAQPGLTLGGEPTTDPTDTVPYADIQGDDDWAAIVTTVDDE